MTNILNAPKSIRLQLMDLGASLMDSMVKPLTIAQMKSYLYDIFTSSAADL